jgi:hypothetical protein
MLCLLANECCEVYKHRLVHGVTSNSQLFSGLLLLIFNFAEAANDSTHPLISATGVELPHGNPTEHQQSFLE